jgi:hypothetical protein
MTRNFSSHLQSWTAQIKLSTGQLLVLKILLLWTLTFNLVILEKLLAQKKY